MSIGSAEFARWHARTAACGRLEDMAGTAFTFLNAAGSRISGRLEPPEGTPRGWAIFAHCFTCGKDNRAAVHISRALSRAGIGVLRFDFAGAGIGEPHQDARAAVERERAQHGVAGGGGGGGVGADGIPEAISGHEELAVEQQRRHARVSAPQRMLDVHARVMKRPGIKAYLASERRIPFNESGIFRHYPELDR